MNNIKNSKQFDIILDELLEFKKYFQSIPREEVLFKYSEVLSAYDSELVVQTLKTMASNAGKFFPTLHEIKEQIQISQRSQHGQNYGFVIAEKKMKGSNCIKCGNTGNWPYTHTDGTSWSRRCHCFYGEQFPNWPTDYQLKQSFQKRVL